MIERADATLGQGMNLKYEPTRPAESVHCASLS